MRKTVALSLVLLTITAISEAGHAVTGRGGKIFTERCVKCHAVNGRGGIAGPDLTGIAARFSEEELRKKLEHPGKSKNSPGINYSRNMEKKEMTALMGYLESLKTLPENSGRCACPY